jgi:hypothetical protein
MHGLRLLAGALLASLFASGIARPPDLILDGKDGTAAILPSDTGVLETLPVVDSSGAARGRVVEVFRLPDHSVSALEIAWTSPQGAAGITIEHPVQFLDFRPDARRIVTHHSWRELLSGYGAAVTAPDPLPPRAGSA